MNGNSQLKKPLLYAMIISVILSAVWGIVVVLLGRWGWFEVRVILTTLVIAVSSLCGLACDLSRTSAGKNILSRAGLGLTTLAAGMVLTAIWFEPHSEVYWRSMAVAVTFALATVHVSLLSIAKLSKRFRLVFPIACQIVFGLAILVSATILFEFRGEMLWRFIAAHSIVVAAVSLVIPILHRISRSDGNRSELLMPVEQRNVDSIDQEIANLEKRISQLKTLRIQIVGQ